MRIIMITNDTNFAWNLRREVMIEFLRQKHTVILIAEILDFQSEFEELGVKLIDIENNRRDTNPLSDLNLFRRYYHTLKQYKPDVVFTNNIKPNVYAGIACRWLGIKYIANITGLGTPVENPGRLQRLAVFLYRLGVKGASTIFFQNTENQAFFHDRGMVHKGTKEVLLPGSGVNLDTHPILPWHEGKTHFLFAARILKEKGIDYVLTAARRYTSEDTIFDICGQCDDPAYYEVLQNEPAVEYHGLQKDLLPLYQKCSCYLYPSYYPEGMSNVLLEAASCGRPVIATDRPGCREIVEDGVTGYVVPVKDEKAVLDAVGRFLDLSREERQRMGAMGRKKMEREFDRRIVVQRYMEEIGEK